MIPNRSSPWFCASFADALTDDVFQRRYRPSAESRSRAILSSSPPPSTRALWVAVVFAGKLENVLYAPPPEMNGFSNGIGKRNFAKYGISHELALVLTTRFGISR